jgi:hypothetical protein
MSKTTDDQPFGGPLSTREQLLIRDIQEDLGLTEFAEEHIPNDKHAQQQLCNAVKSFVETRTEALEEERSDLYAQLIGNADWYQMTHDENKRLKEIEKRLRELEEKSPNIDAEKYKG